MRFSLAGLATLPLLASCAGGPAEGPAWEAVDLTRLSAEQEVQVATAMAAREALVQELMGTLSAELEAGGPVAAIGVCKDRAPVIAAETGEQFGVRIGRTSWKLRNPANAAPTWAGRLLEERPEEPRAASDGRRLGVTLPIRVAGRCLACHGSEATMTADVRDAIAARYPEDRATGFREGDLRGWFWVEVPPPAP